MFSAEQQQSAALLHKRLHRRDIFLLEQLARQVAQYQHIEVTEVVIGQIRLDGGVALFVETDEQTVRPADESTHAQILVNGQGAFQIREIMARRPFQIEDAVLLVRHVDENLLFVVGRFAVARRLYFNMV